MTQKRDSHGRFKADHHKRNIAIGATTAVGAVAGLVGAALRFGLLDRLFPHSEGHAAPDLAEDQPHPDGSERAPYDFRPDATAAVTPDEREALRPASFN
ncbi:hypothetical protein EAH79_07370 [Sphingomonas koreensis]|nr:hypothetical protein EAH87_06705 [Sphingomonas koreensis]TPG43558.1 hypothetical protein EAH79_07370 [Sphingomonas koreensis]